MTGKTLLNLVRMMLTQPRVAAAGIIEMNFTPQILWMAMTLISISLSVMVSGVFHLMPLPADETGDVIRSMLFYSSPLAFALVNWGNAVLSIFVLFWTGRLFGGTGQIRDVLSVTILFQATVILILVGLGFLGMLLPMITAVTFLVFALWLVWAMVSVIDVAHRFDNLFKAVGVFLMATVVVPFGLSIILGAVTAPFIGAR